ncbi:MAG: ABC transporter permease subunit, partial [Lactococcus sp.]|nr:ABC transporter permease subunit [Lactococcus sp.]
MVSSGLEILFDGTNIARILTGMLRVAEISICSLLIGFLFGIIFGILRTSESIIIKLIFKIYLEIFRIMPLLVLLFLFYYILPEIFQTTISNM